MTRSLIVANVHVREPRRAAVPEGAECLDDLLRLPATLPECMEAIWASLATWERQSLGSMLVCLSALVQHVRLHPTTANEEWLGVDALAGHERLEIRFGIQPVHDEGHYPALELVRCTWLQRFQGGGLTCAGLRREFYLAVHEEELAVGRVAMDDTCSRELWCICRDCNQWSWNGNCHYQCK